LGNPVGKVKLTKISSQSFEHELDRKALEALKKTIGFDRLMRALTSITLDKIAGVSQKHNSVKVGPKQVPNLWRLYVDVCDTLDMEPPPLYVQNSPVTNAFTTGVEEPLIVVTSGLLKGFTDDEIQSVLGHELGHFMAGHVLYRTVATTLSALLVGLGQITFGLGELLKLGIIPSLFYWYRCAELTSDRAGLLAVQNPRIVLTMEMKLAAGDAGRFSEQLDLDAFLAQARECAIDDDRWSNLYRALLEVDRTHPWPVVRAREIERWVKAGDYERILGGEYVRRAAAAVANGKHPNDGEDSEAGAAAAAEVAIMVALARAYGVHVAPRVPERALHLALGSYVEPLVEHERVVALYDDTFSGTGDKGVVVTNMRLFTSTRPKNGIRFREIQSVEELASGLLSRPGLRIDDLDLKFHTRDVRDAFKAAVVAGMEAHRPVKE
jgi:Zn-dependent protease with chaperone function